MRATEARELFDRNARLYDRVNTVLSLGLDRGWRRWVVTRSVRRPGAKVVDAMSGTGAVAVEAARLGARVTAVDVSPEMLAVARRRARAAEVVVRPVLADLTSRRGLASRDFDAACLSFGLRYVDDGRALLRSLAGTLRPGGRLVVLEFCVPRPTLLSRLASLYFFRVIPVVGAWLGAGRELYDYLSASTQSIGTAEEIERLITDAGLTVVERATFGFGLVAGFVAQPEATLAVVGGEGE